MRALLAPATQTVREAFANLYSELIEFTLAGDRAHRCALTALAVALAIVLALILRVDDVWWAAISAFMSSQATAPASIQRGILRILGTLAGAGLALLLSPWLASDPVALALVLFVVSTTGVLGLLVSPHGYAWLLSAITAGMVLFALLSDPASALSVGVNRVAEVVVGTLSAMLVAHLLGPDTDSGPAATPPPGWSGLLDKQWPATQHALQAGLSVMLVPFVWNWLDLPGLSQSAITVAAVMAIPAVSDDEDAVQNEVAKRAVHRILGCLLGGIAGLALLALSVDRFVEWMLMLTAGIWIAAHVQASERGVGYVGTQGAIVFISTLVQGPGPPTTILPGIERFTGITIGLLILMAVSFLTAPSNQRSDAQALGPKPESP